MWLHAASVGETNAVLPLIERLTHERPDLPFVLTTGTVTSAALPAQRLGPRGRPPVRAARRARVRAQVSRPLATRPRRVHRVRDLAEPHPRDGRARIPLALVNGRMSARSFRRWKRNGAVSRAALLALRSSSSRRTRSSRCSFSELGARNVDCRRQSQDRRAAAAGRRARARSAARRARRPAGVRRGEHARGRGGDRRRGAPPARARRSRGLHDHRPAPSRARDRRSPRRLKGMGFTVAQRSAGQLPTERTDIYIADTIGELGTLYALDAVAFIGGSLVEHGGQNPIEADRPRRGRADRPALAQLPRLLSRALAPQGRARRSRRADELADGRERRSSPTRPSSRGCARAPRRRCFRCREPSSARPTRSCRCCLRRRGCAACLLTSPPGGTAPARGDGLPRARSAPFGHLVGRHRRGPLQARASPIARGCPVICIGNFTAGGTGKTPLALLLVEHLQALGELPPASRAATAARSRARLGRSRRGHGARGAATSPCCSARAAPTLVARDRRAGARGDRGARRPAPSSSWTTACRTRRLPRTLSIAVVDGRARHRQRPRHAGGPVARAPRVPARPRRLHRRQRADPAGRAHESVLDDLEARTFRARCLPPTREAHRRHRLARGGRRSSPMPASATRALLSTCSSASAPTSSSRERLRRSSRLHARPTRSGSWRTRTSSGAMLVTTEKDMARLAGGDGDCGRLKAASRRCPFVSRSTSAICVRLASLIEAAVKDAARAARAQT